MVLQGRPHSRTDGIRSCSCCQGGCSCDGYGTRYAVEACRFGTCRASAQRRRDIPLERTRRPDLFRAARTGAKCFGRTRSGKHPSAADQCCRYARCGRSGIFCDTALAVIVASYGRGICLDAVYRTTPCSSGLGHLFVPFGGQCRCQPLVGATVSIVANGTCGP